MAHVTRSILAAAVVASAALAVPTTADAAHAPRNVTATAKAAGVTSAGGGYAGWAAPKKTTATPRKATLAQPNLASDAQLGIDVSSYQGDVDWASYASQGVTWAYTKATEGNYYKSPSFSSQYIGSYNQGLVRGAYHFATPNDTDGATQANYFVDNGGGWSADGKTLPGMLDIENNPYGATCYGLSQSDMVNWIAAFANQYKARTGRDVVIYTNAPWWSSCTGNSAAFTTTNPLDIAAWGSEPTTLPGGWPFYTFWQFTDTPVDKNWFNGNHDRLVALASNS